MKRRQKLRRRWFWRAALSGFLFEFLWWSHEPRARVASGSSVESEGVSAP